MASLTVDVHGRIRNLWIGKHLGYVAVAIGSDRMLRWALGLIRLEMKVGNGRWETFGWLQLDGGFDGGTLDWKRPS